MDLLDLLQGPALVFLFPVIMLALLRVIAPDGIDLEAMLRLPSDSAWPRGMQEEEPVRWRVELLSRPRNQPAAESSEQRGREPSPART